MLKDRINYLKEKLEIGEAAIIAYDANRLYYTGFPSSAGYLAVTRNKSVFFIDFRYCEKAAKVIEGIEVILIKSFWSQLNEFFKKDDIKTVFLETDSVSIGSFENYKSKLADFEISRENKLQKIITEQRSIKSAEEISFIKTAQDFTDKTFSYILNRINTGRTEREVMLDMEFFMRSLGSEGVAFDFIVVSGKNSSLPHGVPTDKKIETGDFVTMDFGAVYKGYRSDMTRTVAVGSVTDKQKTVYDTVLKAQTAALDYIKSGVKAKDVDKIARDIIANEGFGDCFGHGLGHSVGIEIHESPALNTSCETVLKDGVIETVEPGIYIENEFGVRIEDMVVVRDNGNENLTHSPKNLIIC